MSQAPLASVVIPCWNQAHFVAEAIESVLGQTYAPLEVLVVDDGSADNTEQVVARQPGAGGRRPRNRGPAAARNAGLAATRGAYVVFLDADDRLLPAALETGIARLAAREELALAVGGCRDIGVDGRVLGEPDQPLVHRDHYAALLKSCFILSGSSVVYARWALEALGGFDERRRAGDDYDLYLRASRRYPIECHGKVVTEYRRHAASLTHDPALVMAGELAALRRQRRHVRGRGERRALRRGRRHARRTHGSALTQRIVEQAQLGHWAAALRTSGFLLSRYPRGLRPVPRELRWALG